MTCCSENVSPPVILSPVILSPVYIASVSSITGFSMYLDYAKNRSVSPVYIASVSSITGFSMYLDYAKNRSVSPVSSASSVSSASPVSSVLSSPVPLRRIVTPDIIKALYTSPTASPKLYQIYSTINVSHYSLSNSPFNSLSNSPFNSLSNSPFNSPSTMRVYYSPNTLARFLSSINETDL